MRPLSSGRVLLLHLLPPRPPPPTAAAALSEEELGVTTFLGLILAGLKMQGHLSPWLASQTTPWFYLKHLCCRWERNARSLILYMRSAVLTIRWPSEIYSRLSMKTETDVQYDTARAMAVKKKKKRLPVTKLRGKSHEIRPTPRHYTSSPNGSWANNKLQIYFYSIWPQCFLQRLQSLLYNARHVCFLVDKY